MGDTSIRLSETAKSRLDLFKREGESYDDVILRLTSRDKWAGFGVASGDPERSREGLREIREEMRDGMERDVESTPEL
jgi:predicted CopG family antitoxin